MRAGLSGLAGAGLVVPKWLFEHPSLDGRGGGGIGGGGYEHVFSEFAIGAMLEYTTPGPFLGKFGQLAIPGESGQFVLGAGLVLGLQQVGDLGGLKAIDARTPFVVGL